MFGAVLKPVLVVVVAAQLGRSVRYLSPLVQYSGDGHESLVGRQVMCARGRRISPQQLTALQACTDEQMLLTCLYDDLDVRQTRHYWHEEEYRPVNRALNKAVPHGELPVLDIERDGTPIGTTWLDWPPPRYFSPDEVRDIVSRLAALGWNTGHHVQQSDTTEVDVYDPSLVDTVIDDNDYPFSYLETTDHIPDTDAVVY